MALICSRTSPLAGAYTGASCSFNLWSAVTCREGLGSDVVIVARGDFDDEGTISGVMF